MDYQFFSLVRTLDWHFNVNLIQTSFHFRKKNTSQILFSQVLLSNHIENHWIGPFKVYLPNSLVAMGCWGLIQVFGRLVGKAWSMSKDVDTVSALEVNKSLIQDSFFSDKDFTRCSDLVFFFMLASFLSATHRIIKTRTLVKL